MYEIYYPLVLKTFGVSRFDNKVIRRYWLSKVFVFKLSENGLSVIYDVVITLKTLLELINFLT